MSQPSSPTTPKASASRSATEARGTPATSGSGSGGGVKHQYTSLSSLMSPSSPSRSQRNNDGGGGVPPPYEPPSPRDAPTNHSSSIISVQGGHKGKGQGQHGNRGSMSNGAVNSGWLSSVREENPSNSRSRSRTRGSQRDGRKKGKAGKMSVWKMLALTISMGGSQIAWTVELGYGTPYLLSLGLSRQLTSLVWLAGPISGLIAQPLIGAISDSSNSRYRRRYWIVTATILLVISGLGLAFTEPVAAALVDLFGGGEGDWDPRHAQLVKNTAIWIAIFSFYCLDFALNGLQASLRNLVLDVTPSEQLASANAWHGRFNHIGNIVGFTLGFLNLANVPIIRLAGGGQFRKVCIVALVILVLTVWITCWTQEEHEKESIFGERRSKLRDIIGTIYEAVLHLPKPVRRVCIVQIAAFMGWFPYLFYSTTYIAEVMAQEQGSEPDPDVATRAGSLALLIYSFVAIAAGTVLPYLAARDRRLLKPTKAKSPPEGPREGGGRPRDPNESIHQDEVDEDDSEDDERDVEMERVREMVREWKREAARQGRPLKLPTMPFMLRNIWTAGLLLFAAVMGSTFFIRTVWQATVAIGVVGICWAIACWVPFAIIMEFLKEMDDTNTTSDRADRRRHRGAGPVHGTASSDATTGGPHSVPTGFRPIHARAASTPLGWRSQPSSPQRSSAFRSRPGQGQADPSERTSLLQRSYSTADVEGQGESMEYTGPGPVAGGTVMGIHNLAIVFPQFIIAAAASIIFQIADGDPDASAGYTPSDPVPGPRAPKNGVMWVLRFGGLMALVGALISRKVPPTKTEKAMRRRLAEMRGESEE